MEHEAADVGGLLYGKVRDSVAGETRRQATAVVRVLTEDHHLPAEQEGAAFLAVSLAIDGVVGIAVAEMIRRLHEAPVAWPALPAPHSLREHIVAWWFGE